MDPNTFQDPIPPVLRPNDYFLLHFADNRQIFAQAVHQKRNKSFPPCKINKRTYSTHSLIGLPYGTVLEVGRDELIPLPDGEDLLPCELSVAHIVKQQQMDGSQKVDMKVEAVTSSTQGEEEEEPNVIADKKSSSSSIIDNRNLIDDNTSQNLTQTKIHKLMSTQTPGSTIVAALISNSATFSSKTAFSQAKYVKRKQLKYQPRCRIVRITPSTLCSAMHLKDARKICNLREDTLGQILSNANICAGQRVMVVDTAVQGIITASCVRRMGGYGSVLSLFCGQQPSYLDVVNRMNFTVMEKQCLKWISIGEVFGDYEEKRKQTEKLLDEETGEVVDVEKRDRDQIQWPAPLQPHTRRYLLEDVKNEKKISEFLAKRSARFTRKLTRNTMLELRELADSCRDVEENYSVDHPSSLDNEEALDATMMQSNEKSDGILPQYIRQCDSLVIATQYDPTATLLRLLPYLAPSCPFVIFHEFLEPLLETFRTIQNYYVVNENQDDGGDDVDVPPMMRRRNIAINLRLTDTWFREFQVLEGRTHPNMNMSQNGGYILLGTKLCPKTGTNEMDEKKVREIRARIGGRRGGTRKKVAGAKRRSGVDGTDNEKRAKER